MAWYLRKAIPLGKFLRLNLSRRGVGASFGIPGLRIGVDAGGKPYVSGGRGGIYFRERLGFGKKASTASDTFSHSPTWLRWLKRLAWTVGLFVAGLMALSMVGVRLGWW
jgi:hypothetical protein